MRQSFIVNITHRQNATWQGTVTWVDKNQTQCFRSALELMFLIDSAVSAEDADESLNKFIPPNNEDTLPDGGSE